MVTITCEVDISNLVHFAGVGSATNKESLSSLINRPGVSGAVLQTPSHSLIQLVSDLFPQNHPNAFTQKL